MFSSDLATSIKKCCGLATLQYFGPAPVEALGRLLATGFDARAITSDKEAAAQAARMYPDRCLYDENLFSNLEKSQAEVCVVDTVLDDVDELELPTLLATLREGFTAIVLLVSQYKTDGVLRDRDWWETRCIDVGMRRHPRCQQIVPYWELDYAQDHFAVFMESIPDATFAKYPLEKLRAECGLRMDMLREVGRRSDAHFVRYHQAALYIRPGDTILDCACGLGYGAHVLFHNSVAKKIIGIDISGDAVRYATDNYGCGEYIVYQQGDVQNLSAIPDASVDFITSFETIEHLPNPEICLKELARVLRPSGRIMISVPNKLTIAHHEARPFFRWQEFDWDSFRQVVSQYFLLDVVFAESVGVSGSCTDSHRIWKTISTDKPLEEDCEWLILLCMLDPQKGRDLPFIETTHTSQPETPDYHATAYSKSYINPWLAKGVTTWPMESSTQRLRLSQEIMEHYPPGSADYGSALCVLAYRQLEMPMSAADVLQTLEKIERYQHDADALPHCFRWKISLMYAGALLQQKIGNFTEAEQWFLTCGNMDPRPFSPMSGTKVTDALYRSALFALMRHKPTLGAERLRQAITTGSRLVHASWFNVVGNESMPVTFGMHDLTQILENLTRCTYALHLVQTWHHRPALALSQARSVPERKIAYLRQDIEAYQREITRLSTTCATYTGQIVALRQENTALTAKNSALAEENKVLAAKNEVQRQIINSPKQLFRKIFDWIIRRQKQ